MTAAVIHGEGLGKRYHRGLHADPGLRHALEGFLRSPISSLRRKKNETFWALKDVSLEVKEGEVLGLIGRNGAGKTTLLRILSRITHPTTGWAEIRRRVGSLLEVGTGFHPELTGRENTLLSGAILGMSRREITRKFDEIVAFAELLDSWDSVPEMVVATEPVAYKLDQWAGLLNIPTDFFVLSKVERSA